MWDSNSVIELFHAVSNQPESQRSQYIRNSGYDPAVKAEVLELLEPSTKPSLLDYESFFDVFALQPGDVLEGRFQIIREIDYGGMGAVYEAEDLMLGKNVAIKIVRPDCALNAGMASRLRQEVKFAQKVTHPNVCRIYDLHFDVQRRFSFVAMELITGETLRARISRQRFTPTEALPLLKQIACGLDAAHAEHVIHRDLSPANIMLVPDRSLSTRAVITDFGIAKAADTVSPRTEVITALEASGNREYMAPEQRDGTVGKPADIYALGLVAYAMVAGEPPPPVEQIILPVRVRLQPRWERAIKRCLSDPDARWTSAGAFVQALEPSRQRQKRIAVIASCVAALICAGVLYLGPFRARPGLDEQVGVARYPDREVSPTFSPGGEQVAFHSGGGTQANNSIYRRQLDGDSPTLRLTSGPDDDKNPAWSPDGSLIAFVRNPGSHGTVQLITPFGEDKGKLTDAKGGSVAWFPDSKYLAVMDRASGNDPYGVTMIEVATGRKYALIPPSITPDCDDVLQFSPDGQYLAFINDCDIFVTWIARDHGPPAAGQVQRLTSHTVRGVNGGFAWMPTSREIIFSADGPSGQTLWKISVTSSRPEPRQLPLEGLNARRLTVSRGVRGKGPRLAYEVFLKRVNIWLVDISTRLKGIHQASRISGSKHLDVAPQFSPDEKRIAFVSDRSRDKLLRIYVCDRNGSSLHQLPSPPGVSEVGSPRWSADGTRIAFDALVNGNRDIYVTDMRSASILRLTNEPSEEARPSWSRDGEWIYFSSDHAKTGFPQICKVRSNGTGGVTSVTHNGGFEAFESYDANYLYYVRSSTTPGLWRVPRNSGTEVPVLESVSEGHWSLAEKGIYYVATSPAKRSRMIEFYPFPGSSTWINPFSWLTHSDSHPIYRADADPSLGLSVSHDGHEMLISLLENGNSQITVLDNFRP